MLNSPVEEIKSRLNIVDVVGEYVKLQKAGANWKANCPFHHEKSPSFMVNEEKQIFHCFGCNKGGDVITFVKEIESLDFKETLKILAEKAGVQLANFNPKVQNEKNKVLEALELATGFYEKQLWDGAGKEKILKYLSDRGISTESIRKFRLGYAPEGWDNILKFLLGKGFSANDILAAGLIIDKQIGTSRYYDRFRDRIMFPVMDVMGKVVGYSARVAPGGDESQAKYINTPETGVYHKSKALYGIFQAKQEIKNKNFVLLVEGNLDVIASHQAGLENTVAVSGTALTFEQLDILKRYTENIKMLFDMDSAGQAAARRSAQLCFEKGFSPAVVALEDGKDAADVVAKDPQKLLEAVSKSTQALEYFLKEELKNNSKNTVGGKKAIAKSLAEIIGHISNKIEKMHWISKLAQELEVEENIIADVIKNASPETSRTFEEKNVSGGGDDLKFAKRSQMICEKIAGLLLANSDLWESVSSDDELKSIFLEDEILRFILKEGKSVNFSYENMVMRVNESVQNRLQEMYFDAKYKFGQNGVEEFDKNQIKEIFDHYLEEYKKELQKERINSIIRDIKKAEQNGDKESLLLLMNEFSKLSKELK
ncbi:MAG: hypothetical protein ACD_11C00115G0003 [uncultured bacterium]|nr:MAG: hypothetical protein ACD_11C00115G0003 [uncultured bacterium]HBR71279.1 DNA primase [Candidatus Moranbacteria bacterium]